MDADAQLPQPRAVFVAARQCAGDELAKGQRDFADDKIKVVEVQEEHRVVAFQDTRQRNVTLKFDFLPST